MIHLDQVYIGEKTAALDAACACGDGAACAALIAEVRSAGHVWFAAVLTEEAWDAGVRVDVSAGRGRS